MSEPAPARPRRWKRTAAAVLSAALLGGATAAALTSFDDVPDAHPHADGVRNAVDRGWFQGYPDGSFKPDKDINLEQLARVLLRAFPDGLTRGEAATFLTGGERHLRLVTPSTLATGSSEDPTVTTKASAAKSTTTTFVCEDDQEYDEGECDDYAYDYDDYCQEDDDDGECDAYDDEYDED